MIGRGLSGLFLLALASCTAEPRSAEYFERHPDAATRLLAQCAAGARGGDECENAQQGLQAIEREARMEAYRQEF